MARPIQLEATIQANSNTTGLAGRHTNISAGIVVPMSVSFRPVPKAKTLVVKDMTVTPKKGA